MNLYRKSDMSLRPSAETGRSRQRIMRRDQEEPEAHWRTIDSAQLPAMDDVNESQSSYQSQESTRRTLNGDIEIDDGVGPQEDEQRGNAPGGFAYPDRERDEQTGENDADDDRQNQPER